MNNYDVECERVSFSYNQRQVVTDLSFGVPKGSYLCIVGENGSGKSTLIKGLTGLKMPSSGTVIWNDSIGKNEIGYLPQINSVAKDFPASVYEIVLSGTLSGESLKLFYSKKDRKTADENIALLGIEGIKNRSFHELSGGQQQRVLLARALCATKKVLVLDEPVAGLDPKVTESFYEIIEKINVEKKITVIMVSHDVDEVIKYATHVLKLDCDKAVFLTKDEYVNGGGSDV